MSELSPERKSALRILRESWDHPPRKTFALFSGGNDSAVLVHWAQPWIDAAVYIDTGTALPGVREFVERFTTRYEIPLLVYEAGDAYERMVLKHGFPGPGAHRYPYVLLKERQVDALVRDHKQERGDRIALLTGVRRAESRRRMGNVREVHRDGAQVWVSPLIDWSDAYMRFYHEKFNLPESDVAALIHRSGECNCAAFAAPREREMLCALYPEFKEWVEDLERRVEAAGIAACRWGAEPPRPVHPGQANIEELAPGPLCVGCSTTGEAEG
jgi:3'-phosphoadenosine 5'-phosphosulfate sulfotransferase (PAPS reductase)/FAD synthetase